MNGLEHGRDEGDVPPARAKLAARIARILPELERHVSRRMGPELRVKESVSDIVQSTARELLDAQRYEDRGEESLRRWLKVAAEHKIRNKLRYWRASGRSEGQELVTPEGTPGREGSGRPSEDAMVREESDRLEQAIRQLAPQHGFVIRRVQLEGASYESVSSELGRTPEAVRKLHARALGRLSSLLRDDGAD